MHYVTPIDWASAATPIGHQQHLAGFAWRGLVGRETGATHTELGVARLAAAGRVDRHLHSFEEAFYVLAGNPVLELGERTFQLESGDFGLAPIGVAHGWSNAGPDEARWMTVSTPQRVPEAEGRRDTFYVTGATVGEAVRPPFGDPQHRWIGHYAGTPPQSEALAVRDPAQGRAPAGMDTALLAYSGISVKMLVDRTFGAELLTMFTVDYEPNGAAQVHDHPFEEAYLFLTGEIDAVLDGREYRVRAGDLVFAGVGSTHGFFNTGSERVRWIETQAPQPPGRHAYRWVDVWKRLETQEGS